MSGLINQTGAQSGIVGTISAPLASGANYATGQFSRGTQAGDGAVNYALSFSPTYMIFFAAVTVDSQAISWGFVDSSDNNHCTYIKTLEATTTGGAMAWSTGDGSVSNGVPGVIFLQTGGGSSNTTSIVLVIMFPL